MEFIVVSLFYSGKQKNICFKQECLEESIIQWSILNKTYDWEAKIISMLVTVVKSNRIKSVYVIVLSLNAYIWFHQSIN